MLTLFTQSDIKYLSGYIVSVQGGKYCSKTDNPLDETKHENSHSHTEMIINASSIWQMKKQLQTDETKHEKEFSHTEMIINASSIWQMKKQL
jgi:hypothetical protein